VIVGGGISGLFTAYFLANRVDPEKILLVERSYIGSGSTLRCATGIRASFTTEEHIVLMKRSIEYWLELSRELGFYLRRGGYVWLLQEEHLDAFKEYSQLHNRFGVPTRIVDREFVAELVPSINQDMFAAALHDPLAMQADPFEVIHTLTRFLKSTGVKIQEFTEVTKLVLDHERKNVEAVVTNKGEIPAENIVVAAGTGTKNLLKSVGVDAPLEPLPKHILITMRYRRLFDPLLIDWASNSYIVQSRYGGFIVGAELAENTSGEAINRIDYMPHAVRIWSKFFKWFPKVYILRYWTGYYVMTPDHHPVYGPVEGVDGVYIAAGFSGHGFMLGPVTGYVTSRWVIDGDPGIAQAKNLMLARFTMGRLIREKAVIG